MLENYSNYDTPSFRRQPAYAFDAPELDLYHELSSISQEIGQCRALHLT